MRPIHHPEYSDCDIDIDASGPRPRTVTMEMFRTLGGSSIVLVTLALIALQSSETAHAAELEAGSDRWMPSVGIVGGLEVQDVKASSSTTNVQPPIFSNNTGPLRPATRGDTRIYSATTGVDFGLMSPRISDRGGLPRFFVHANLEANLAAETQPTAEGARGAIRGPNGATGAPLTKFQESSVLGQGTQGLVKIDPLQVRAGAGMAFTFVLGGRRLRIKPSIEYVRKRMESRGGITRVVQIGGTRPLGQPTIDLANFDNQVRIAGVEIPFTSTLHGIGPGLEVELDIARAGASVISLFSSFSAYRFLGNLTERGTGSTNNPTNPDPVPIPETATFRFKYDPWSYRAGAGIRIRWQPE